MLALVLCSVFGAAAFLTIQAVEAELIQNRLTAEFDRLVARQRQGLSTDLPVGTQLLRDADIPERLRGLAPGFHEVTVGERALHVLASSDSAGQLILLDDESNFERVERNVTVALSAAFLGCVLLAWLLGRVSASRVVAPLTSLSEAVQSDIWQDELPGLDSPDETGMLARAFAARSRELREFLVRERLFTGDVSHELRTPLTVILGAAELLLLKLDDQPVLAQAAERIRRTASEASERVAALLLLSRSPEAIDAPRTALRALVEHEMERCRPLLAGKPVELRLEAGEEAWVFARPELAAIAIGNLVRNACQFTERGAVTVRLTPELALIEDTGAGVPDAVRLRLFERFVRGTHDHVTGSGLGLAIVKRVAEHLGWELRLEDRDGGGTRSVLKFRALNESLMQS